MKRMNYVLLIIFAGLFVACMNSQNSNSAKNEKVKGTEKPVPEGWLYGSASPYLAKDEVERNLINQVNAYKKAMSVGDVNDCSKYLYGDIIRYYKRRYPELPEDEIVELLLKRNMGILANAQESYSKAGLSYDIIVNNVIKRISEEESIIILFTVTGVLSNNEKAIHTEPEVTIGISSNKGKDWHFMGFADEVQDILRMKFNEETVNEIMNH